MTTVLRWAILIPLFTIPFIPLYVANTMYFPFITGKGFAFRILVEIAFCAWAALAIIDTKYRPRFSWTLVIFGAFTLWMLIADLFAVNAHKALWSNFERMDGWVTLIHLFLFFLVAGTVLSADKLWKHWWFTFIGVSAAVCGYSLLQLAGGIQINQGGVRVDATFGNATYLAVYLLFSFFITLWQSFESKGWLRYTLIALAALQLIILFNTATRGAILGVVGAGVFAAFLWTVEAGKRGRGIAAGAVIALIVVIGGFFLLKDTSFVRESPILGRIASISLSEGATRLTLWTMAGEALMERPITGYGQEGFNYVFNEHYRPSLYGQEPWFDRAHNLFVDWLVAGGIPGFILFVSLIGSAVFALYRSDASRPMRIFLIAALAGYSIQGLFVFDNLFSYVPLVAIFAIAHHASSREWKRVEGLPVASGDQANAIVSSAAFVAAVALIWVVNVPNIRAANHLVYAISPLPEGATRNLAYFREALADGSYATQEIREQIVSSAGGAIMDPQTSQSLKNDFAQLMLTEIEKEVERAPGDARLRVQYSTAYRMVGEFEKAIEQAKIAQSLSPLRQSFLIEEAVSLTELGRFEEARAVYRKAYDLDPSFPQIAAYVATGEIMVGNDAAAKQVLLEAFGTTSVNSPPLIRAYYETKRYNDLIEAVRVQVRETNGSADARYRLATAYALAGRIAEARAEANAAITAHPATAAQGRAFIEQLNQGR